MIAGVTASSLPLVHDCCVRSSVRNLPRAWFTSRQPHSNLTPTLLSMEATIHCPHTLHPAAPASPSMSQQEHSANGCCHCYQTCALVSTGSLSLKQPPVNTCSSSTACQSSSTLQSPDASSKAAAEQKPPASMSSRGVIFPHDNKASPFHELDLMDVWEGVRAQKLPACPCPALGNT